MEVLEPHLARSDFSRGSWESILKSSTRMIIKCWPLMGNTFERCVAPPPPTRHTAAGIVKWGSHCGERPVQKVNTKVIT